MTMLIILAFLIIACVVLANKLTDYYDYRETIGVACSFVATLSGALLFFALITIPTNRMGSRDALVQIEAVRNTQPLSTIQDAAWRMKAADANAQLASMKYWNNTAFDIWIPDDVDAVEPLQ